MPPRRRALAANPIDVEVIRRRLAEGKIVRVGIAGSAQFPDGGTGRVRQVGDPEVDGEEFVLVEVTLNGTRDVLPFTPTDLMPATRGRPPGSRNSATAPAGAANKSRQGRTVAPRTAVPQAPAQGGAVQQVTAPRTAESPANATRPPDISNTPDSVSAGTNTGAQQSANGSSPAAQQPASISGGPRDGRAPALPAPGSAPSTAPPAPKPSSVQERSGAGSVSSVGAAPPETRTKSPRGARRPPVAITVATTDADPTQWRIEARVGAKVALRSGSVSPARVWELVRMLDNEMLTRAVGSILDEQRAAAQARADALAAELERVRAELADLPDGTR